MKEPLLQALVVQDEIAHGLPLPTRGHPDDVAFDIFTAEDTVIPGFGSADVRTGIHITPPPGYYFRVVGKGSSAKSCLTFTLEIIDSGYTGEIILHPGNHSEDPVRVRRGQAIAQLELVKITRCELKQVTLADLPKTSRGAGRMNSTKTGIEASVPERKRLGCAAKKLRARQANVNNANPKENPMSATGTPIEVQRLSNYGKIDLGTSLHPELKTLGPTDYKLGDIEEWVYRFPSATVPGHEIYDLVREAGDLNNHLDWIDLQAIQSWGDVNAFRQHFRSTAVIAWKSVAQFKDGSRRVAYLALVDENRSTPELLLRWLHLNDGWGGDIAWLRFNRRACR